MFEIKKDKTHVEMNIHIPADEWEKGVQATYEKTKSKFNVVGFRKGHAPRKVIEKTYGDSVFFDDTLNFFYEKSIEDAIKQNPVYEPAVTPQLTFESFTFQDGLKMKVTYEVIDEFKLPKVEGVEIEVHSADVKEKEIEYMIKRHLSESATIEEKDKAIENGDIAVIDYVGSVDGIEFDGGKASDYDLEIGSHTFIDNFEEQLVGLKKGDKKDVKVTFPENYHAENLKGAKAVFKVTVKAVKQKILPQLDDKFVADTTEFETVQEYRKSVIDNISRMKANAQKEEFVNNMNKYLTDNTQIEFPQSLLDMTYHNNLHAIEDRAKMFGMSTLDFVTNFGGAKTMEEFIEKSNANALRQLKLREIYVKLIHIYDLQLTAEETKKATAGLSDEHQISDSLNHAQVEKIHDFLRAKNKMKILKDEE